MKYSIYKLLFKAPVHFGKGRLSGSAYTFCADTLFSALCKEMLKLYGDDGAEKLCTAVKDGKFKISDAMPYCGDTFYVPKPIAVIEGTKQSDSVMKKKFKKLTYIPVEDINSYFSGNYEPSAALEKLDGLGKSGLRAGVAVKRLEDNEPFNIGTYTFSKNCGLYFIAGTDSDEAADMLDDAMNSLAYTGIGGKVSSGFGSFDYRNVDVSAVLLEMLEGDQAEKYMSLSVSMPQETELAEASEEATFELIKRSGFVASDTFAEVPQKKREFYCFKGGSCFKKKFNGDIYDVSSGGGHPVYRYAVPMFIGIKQGG